MVRVQLHLLEAQDRWLEERAQAQGTTKSALMREALQLLQAERAADQEHLLKLLDMADYDPEGPTDGSINHDRYLMEWEYKQNHPEDDS